MTKFRALAPILKGPKKGQLVWWNDVMTDGHSVITDFRICSDKYLKGVKAICQYSGLPDSKETEIYAGDIIYIAGYGDYVAEFPFTELYDAGPEGDIGEIKGNIHTQPIEG